MGSVILWTGLGLLSRFHLNNSAWIMPSGTQIRIRCNFLGCSAKFQYGGSILPLAKTGRIGFADSFYARIRQIFDTHIRPFGVCFGGEASQLGTVEKLFVGRRRFSRFYRWRLRGRRWFWRRFGLFLTWLVKNEVYIGSRPRGIK